MSDQVFVDKSTGEEVRIVNEETNFYVLDNSVRIKKDIFAKRYNESVEIDPASFFQPKYNTNDPLATIANQLKNLDASKVSETGGGAQVKYTPPIVLSDTSMPARQVQGQIETQQAPANLTPEERKKMMEEFRRTQPGAQIPEVQDREYDDDRFLNGDKPIAPIAPRAVVDPIQMMFKMFKSNYPVKLNLTIEENIPNPTFIGMVQENVDADAVEYYANLISQKILKDPEKLKTEIYTQLKKIINNELGIEEIVPTNKELPTSGSSGVFGDEPTFNKNSESAS